MTVLGTGCAKCNSTLALIEQVAQAKGVAVTLSKVEELRDIMGDGVMSTPGVVFNGKVVHAGGLKATTTTTLSRGSDQWLTAVTRSTKAFQMTDNTPTPPVAPVTEFSGVLLRKKETP